MSDEPRHRVLVALWEGANPRGFSGDNRRAYEELLEELGEDGLAEAVAGIGKAL